MDPAKPLGTRESVLLEILTKNAAKSIDGSEYEFWATVRSLQAYIFQNSVPRVGRRDWNYVVIQSALADLLGRGLVTAKAGRGQELLYRAKSRPLRLRELADEVRAATEKLESLDLDKPATTADEALQAAFQR